MKSVLVLVGPKGAGKSTIGHVLASDLGLHFLRVEPIFLEVRARLGATHPRVEPVAFQAVLRSLRESPARYDSVCLETTGASVHVPCLLSELRQEARVLLVRVLAAPDQCLARLRSRDASIHIPVSDDQAQRIDALAEAVSLPWTVELDNRDPLDRPFVVATVRDILAAATAAAGA